MRNYQYKLLVYISTCLLLSLFANIVHSQNIKRTFETVLPTLDFYKESPFPLELAMFKKIVTAPFPRSDGSIMFGDSGVSFVRFRAILNETVNTIMGDGLLTTDNIKATDLKLGSSIGSFTYHPLNGNFIFLDTTNKKIRMLDNNNMISTLANITTLTSSTVFAFDKSGTSIYFNPASMKIVKLDLLTNIQTNIIGANYVLTTSKGYVEGLPGDKAGFNPSTIVHTGDELYFTNTTHLSKLDKNGIFRTLAGIRGSSNACTFNATYSGNATLACLSSPRIVRYTERGEIYLLDNACSSCKSILRKFVNESIEPVLKLDDSIIVGVTSSSDEEFLLTTINSVLKFNVTSGELTTVMAPRASGPVCSPKYSAYVYGAQGTFLRGIQRKGDYVMSSSNSFCVMSRKSGIMTKIVERSNNIMKSTLDHTTDDIYFGELDSNTNMYQIYRYLYKERRIELFAGSNNSTTCSSFVEGMNSLDLCINILLHMTVKDNYLYITEYTMYRVLKIDMSTGEVYNVFGTGYRRHTRVSGIGNILKATEFKHSVIMNQHPNGKIYAATSAIVVEFDNLAANSTVSLVAGNNTIPRTEASFYSIAVHPTSKDIYHVMAYDDSKWGLYKLSNGIDTFITNLTDPQYGLVIKSNNLVYFSGKTKTLYEYNLLTNTVSTVITERPSTTTACVCMSLDEKYILVGSVDNVNIYLYDTVAKTYTTYSVNPLRTTNACYTHSNGLIYLVGNLINNNRAFYSFNVVSKQVTVLPDLVVPLGVGTSYGNGLIVKSEKEVYFSDYMIYKVTPNNTEKIGGGYSGGYISNTDTDPSGISIYKNEIFFDNYGQGSGFSNVFKVDLTTGIVEAAGGTNPIALSRTLDNFDVSQASKFGDCLFSSYAATTFSGVSYIFGASFIFQNEPESFFLANANSSSTHFGGYPYTSIDDDFYGGQLNRLLYDCGTRDQYGHCPRNFTCFGVHYMNLSSCNGNGDCYDQDTCDCYENYGGVDCSTYLLGNNETTNVTTSLNQTNFNSSVTEFNTTSNSSLINNNTTSLNETISNNNISTIVNSSDYGNETSADNTTLILNDTFCINENCSFRGICNNASCLCQEGYYGLHCELFSCFGIPSFNNSACSGNGTCNSLDNCTCNNGYYGLNCNISQSANTPHNDTSSLNTTQCFGISNTSSLVCNGNGSCLSTDSCTCNDGYYGEECQYFKCFGIAPNDSSTICSGNGLCISKDICLCASNYTGFNCSFLIESNQVVNHTLNSTTITNQTISLNQTINNQTINNQTIISNQTIVNNETSTNQTISNNQTIVQNQTVVQNQTMLNNQTLTNNTIESNQTVISNQTFINQTVVSNQTMPSNQTIVQNQTNIISNQTVVNTTQTLVTNQTIQTNQSSSTNSTNVQVTCYGISSASLFVCSGHGQCKAMDQCLCRNGYSGKDCSEEKDPNLIISPIDGNGNISVSEKLAISIAIPVGVVLLCCWFGCCILVCVCLRRRARKEDKENEVPNNSSVELKYTV